MSVWALLFGFQALKILLGCAIVWYGLKGRPPNDWDEGPEEGDDLPSPPVPPRRRSRHRRRGPHGVPARRPRPLPTRTRRAA